MCFLCLYNIYIYIYISIICIVEGSLEVKLPTIWTDEKQRWEESQRWEGSEKRREEERRSKRESLRRKQIQVREKVGKSRNTVFFPMIYGSGGSKSRLAKAAGAEPAGQMRLCEVEMSKKWTRLWREAHFQVKMHKTLQPWITLTVEMSKKCTPLWREAHFEVKMLKSTTCSDHF